MPTNFGKIGEAFVELEVDLRRIADDLKAAQPSLARLGESLGKEIDRSIGKGLELKVTQERIGSLGQNFQNIGQIGTQVGRTLAVGLTGPIVAAGAFALKTGVDFETAFAGVRKTVDATETEFAALSEQFRAMSKEIPVSAVELANIGEAAGQLGIQTENIAGFTRTMAELGIATNLASTEAATALARLANITGLPQSQFDRLGASIVDLGNNLATTESEIVDFGLRIAGAGKLAGLSEAEILGIGAAMSSIGVQAEAGGTSVQKVLNAMTQAVATSNESLAVFASTAGMSAATFSEAFREDAAGAFTDFVEGLGIQGEAAFTTLENLGLQNERVIRAFLGLAGAGDVLSRSLAIGIRGFEDNLALQEETAKRIETTASQFELLKAELVDVGIELFETIGPVLKDDVIPLMRELTTAVGDAAARFGELPDPVKRTALAAAGLTAALGPIVFIAGSVAGNIGLLLVGLGKTATGAGIAAGAIAAAKVALGTFLTATTGAVVATGLLGTAAGMLANRFQVVRDAADFVTSKLIENTQTGRNAAAAQEGLAFAVGNLEERLRELGVEVAQGPNESLDEYADRLGDVMRAHLALGKDSAALEFFESLDDAVRSAATSTAGMLAEILGLTPALDAAGDVVVQLTEEQKEAAEELEKSISSLVDSVTDAADVSGVLEAALTRLEAQGVPTALIVGKLGDGILETAATMRTLGQEVPAVIAEFERATLEVQRLQQETNLLNEIQEQLADTQEDLSDALAKTNVEWAEASMNVGEARDAMQATHDETVEFFKEVGKLLIELDDMGESIEGVEAKLRFLTDAGLSNSEILAVMAAEIKAAAAAAEALGVDLGELTTIFNDQIEASEASAKESDRWEDAWSTAVGNVTSDFADAVADMLFEGEGFSFDLKGIFKELGKSLVEILVVDAFGAIAQALSGLAGDLGGAIGGVFGIGGGRGGGRGTVAGAAAGAAAGGGISLGTGAASSALGIIGAAGLAGFAIFKGIQGLFGKKARDFADDFGEQIQIPFGDVLETIADTIRGAQASGTLSREILETAIATVEDLWDAFQINAAEFAQQGDKAALVVRQSLEGTTPWLTQLLSDWRTMLDDNFPVATESTNRYWQAVSTATEGVDDLTAALHMAEEAGVPTAAIIETLGRQIEDMGDTLRLFGDEVPPIIEKYEMLIEAQREFADAAVESVGKVRDSVMDMIADLLTGSGTAGIGDIGVDDLAQTIIDEFGPNTPIPFTRLTPEFLARFAPEIRDMIQDALSSGTLVVTPDGRFAIRTDPRLDDVLRAGTTAIPFPLVEASLPQYQTGTDFVPFPHIAGLDRGEAVLTAADNRLLARLASEANRPTSLQVELTMRNEFNFAGTSMSPLTVRDAVIPEITRSLELGIRGVRDRWKTLLAEETD